MNDIANTSVHLPYDQTPQPYHEAVASLVSKHCVANGHLLDIGCGVGHTLAIVHRERPDILLTIADIDDNCLAITSTRVPLAGQRKIAGVEDLFDGQAIYDCIVMSHSLEHMHEPVRVVREVMRLLKPGGVLVLAVPNPVRPAIIWSNLRRRKNVNLGHVMAWDRSHWMNFIEVILGLNAIEYAVDYFQFPGSLSEKLRFVRKVERGLVKLFPWFSMSNIVAVRKS